MKNQRKMFLLFSHKLTPVQKNDAIKKFRITDIKVMPEHLQKLWSNIPADLENIEPHLGSIKNWMEKEASENDCVLIQGDFGATFLMVNFAIEKNLIPLYATTVRDAKETIQSDGTIVMKHIFKFCKFRQYGK